jgi:hypothetical protein
MNGGIGIAATTHLEQQRRCNPPKKKKFAKSNMFHSNQIKVEANPTLNSTTCK